MQAIVTKFLGPTNTRPSRIKATCQARSITLSWEHAWNPMGNHRAAAQALATQLGWHGRWIEGDLPDGSSVWTLDDQRSGSETFTVDALDMLPSSRALNRARKRAFAEPEVDGMGNRLDGMGPLSD